MKFFKNFFYLLSNSEKKKMLFLLFMVFIVAILETLGIASIMPFIAVLTNPELIETNVILNNFYLLMRDVGIKNEKEFIFILGIFVFLFLIISIFIKALTTFSQYRFALMCEYSIGKRLLETYVNKPYSWFLNRNSSDLGKNILSEVDNIIQNGALPMLILITQSFVFIAIFLLLILINPYLTLSISLILSAIYGLIYKFSKNYLNVIGKKRFQANEQRFITVNEAFGSPKELKIARLENFFVNKFSLPAKHYAKYQTSAQIISLFPRYFLEAIIFGGLILTILYLISVNGNFNSFIPIITLYVFAGYRILPALQQIYNSIIRIRFVEPSIEFLLKDYENKIIKNNIKQNNMMDIKDSITIRNVDFEYPNTSKKILNFQKLNIKANSKVALVGPTGSGKTTTIDLILGLLSPNNSILEIDGKVINYNNIGAWHNSVGYVPQQIYLIDSTIAANIAFGIDHNNIDYKSVESAAKIANIHEFIMNNLPNKYETKVGERGVRLSGGQRQRIGLARALYRNPKVLILDEATSALDSLTEKEIMGSLDKLHGKMTIVMIAHRLSTVKNCDKIFLLEKGKLKTTGKFEDLALTNSNFQNIN